jgi:hypothetical protein
MGVIGDALKVNLFCMMDDREGEENPKEARGRLSL